MNLTKVISKLSKDTDEDARRILRKAVQWQKEQYPLDKTAKPGFPFRPVVPDEVDTTDVLVRMAEYSHWVSYFTYQSNKWKAVQNYIEGLYDTLWKQYVATSTKESSDRKRECAARALYSPVERASQFAKQKALEYAGKLESATLQYNLCSRIITFTTEEKKVNR